MELPSSFLNALTLQPGSTTMTESGRQSSSAPCPRMASMRRFAWSSVIAGIGISGCMRRARALFRFALGSVTPKTWDGGWAKEATVAEFPVSEKLAGVLMSLAPGALRELHWHANAAEWAYVIKGQCRVTTIDPKGHSEIVDFNSG